MKVFNKDQMNAVNAVVDIIRQRAATMGYGVQADQIIERALAEATQHPATDAAKTFAEGYVTELFNGGGVTRFDREEITAKVVEVFCAGHDNASAVYGRA